MNVCAWTLGALAGVAASTSALGQPYIGPSLGTVEFRWRERSTPGYNGSYMVGPGTAPGVDAIPTPDPSAASVTAQDASVVLVLEAKVTNSNANPGLVGRGLLEAVFSVTTNQVTGGAFARQNILDFASTSNPRGNAKVNTRNLGFDPSTLVNHPSGTPRGVVSPFRAWADAGASPNSTRIGVVTPDLNTIDTVFPRLHPELFDPASVDATNPGEYGLAGLDTWVPVFIAIYTITDVLTPRDIVFTLGYPSVNPSGGDLYLRTWAGMPNPQNAGLDEWALSSNFTSPPRFTVHVVPGPGAAGVLAPGCAVAIRRRRR